MTWARAQAIPNQHHHGEARMRPTIVLADDHEVVRLSATVTLGRSVSDCVDTTHTSANQIRFFYKVGHHGSHNATLKKHGLEMMTSSELMAMIPVDRKQAASKTSKTNPKGWEMPEKNLFERLLQRTRGRVILADETEDKGSGSDARTKSSSTACSSWVRSTERPARSPNPSVLS